MSLIPHNLEQISRSAISLPGDYARAVRLREMAIAADLDVPRYLLEPEISVLLSYLPDLRQRVLIETLWNTGARINEALALTPSDFFQRRYAVCQTADLKATRTTNTRKTHKRRTTRSSISRHTFT